MSSEPIPCVCVSIPIEAMLNFISDFDVVANADVTCKQGYSFTLSD